MKILLIGGTRFLGRYIVDDLAGRGHEVTVINRGRQPPHERAAGALACDKADRAAFAAALLSDKWDAIIDTILDAADLEFAIETINGRVGHFIHTGSIGVYASERRREIPSRESDPLADHDAEYNFGAKLAQDRVVMRAHNERAFPATVLRMSNIYGPGDIPLDGWGGRATQFFRMMRDGKPVPLPDGGCALIHPGYAADLASAFGDTLESRTSLGQVYNIGGPRAIMMRDYIGIIAEAMGVSPRFETAAPEDVLRSFPESTSRRGLLFVCKHMCCDTAKAGKDLGWFPATSLDVGLRANVNWMKSQQLI